MSYNDFLGTLSAPEEQYTKLISDRYKLKSFSTSSQYDNVRYGLPSGAISWEKEKDGRMILLDHFRSQGYKTWPAKSLNPQLRKHIALFRASLDLWEELCPERSMCKDEIYYRSIAEGPSFTEWVKKARATSFRCYTSETQTNIEDEYLLHDYRGYNSLIHERYLIHWDDTESIDDVKYAFIKTNKGRPKEFRKRFRKLLEDYKIDEIQWPESLDMIQSMKNSQMYDPNKKKTYLMREFWEKGIDARTPYFAKRTIVPVEPGGTRDTGIGDPSTILKVKQINLLTRVISEALPYSANAPASVCNSRYKRVLKRNAFLHLDFKKYGLTFPRELMNIALEEIGRVSGIDTEPLLIKNFYVEIDGEVYETERGTMLGWLDSLNALCVAAILYWLSNKEGLKFDFIIFNDDVEISKYAKHIKETLELLRGAIVADISSFDIGISADKTYGSKGSVFLERYAYYERHYGLDMYKEQLTVKAYAASLVTEHPWQAKLFFGAAEQWTKSQYATERCIDTCPIEFRKEEITLPIWAGGWYIRITKGLDWCIHEVDTLGYFLALELAKFKNEKYSTRREDVSSPELIADKVNELTWYAKSPSLAREKWENVPSIDEIGVDIGQVRSQNQTFCDLFPGVNVEFTTWVTYIIEKAMYEDVTT